MYPSILRTIVGAVLTIAVGTTTAVAGETCYHLEGKTNDGCRHLDRLYLRTSPVAINFVLASYAPAVEQAAAAISDVSGRGAWQRSPALDLGEWKCLAIEFENPAAASHLLLWTHQPSGKLFYQGFDARGRLLFAGEGRRR